MTSWFGDLARCTHWLSTICTRMQVILLWRMTQSLNLMEAVSEYFGHNLMHKKSLFSLSSLLHHYKFPPSFRSQFKLYSLKVFPEFTEVVPNSSSYACINSFNRVLVSYFLGVPIKTQILMCELQVTQKVNNILSLSWGCLYLEHWLWVTV